MRETIDERRKEGEKRVSGAAQYRAGGQCSLPLSISAHLECKCGFYMVPLCCF